MLKNKFKKLAAVLIAFAMVLSLTACGSGGSESTPDSRPGPETTQNPDTGGEAFDGDDYVMLQQAMIDTTDMAAVAYLGWYDEYYDLYDYSQIQDFIADSLVAEDHPFIANIDADHFVPHIGGELYCIVPADENTTVFIYDYVFDYDNYTGDFGDLLYAGDDGKPVIVMGNESEFIPNIIVEICDSDGNMLDYIPCLSGMDGSLVVPDETYGPDSPTLLDFTPYEKLGYVTEGNYGYAEFDPAVLYYGENWTSFVDTINDDTVAVGFWFDEYGNMEMCYEVYGGEGYEVYYEGHWYPAEDSDYPDSTLIFELELVEDTSDIQIARPEIYTAMSFEYDEMFETVFMTYEDYDYLLDVESHYYYSLEQAMG